MSLPRSIFVWLALVASLVPRAAAQGVAIDIDANDGRYVTQLLTHHVEDGITADDPARVAGLTFAPITTDNLAFPPHPLTVRLAGDFVNTGSEPRAIALSFNPTYLGEVTVSRRSDGRVLARTGTLVEDSHQPLARDLVAKLTLDPGTTPLLISIRSFGAVASVKLATQATFAARTELDTFVFAGLIGALAILFFYNLAIYATSRQSIYLLYSSYILSTILLNVTLSGYGVALLPVNVLGFPVGYAGSLLFGSLFILSLTALSLKLLEVGDKHPRLRRLFKGIIVVAGLNALAVLATAHFGTIIATRLLGVVFCFSMTGAGIYLSLKGSSVARLYLASWAPILISGVLMISHLTGLTGENTLTSWAMPASSVIESLVLAVAIGTRLDRLNREKMEEQRARIQAFQQIEENFNKLRKRDEIIKSFVRPSILTEISLGKDPLEYRPRILKRAVFFIDIRDYTKMSENCTPEEAHDLLNLFFNVVNSKVFEYRGEVDKLMGDCVMAVFPDPDDCLAAAVAIRQSLVAINRERFAAGLTRLRCGMGLAYGDVLNANFGSRHKLDRTNVGDVVNVAARLEALTKSYRTDILCTHEFYEAVDAKTDIRILDSVHVKGKSREIKICELYEHNPQNVRDYKAATKADIARIIDRKQSRDVAGALEIVQRLIDECPAHTWGHDSIMDPTLLGIRESLLQQDRTTASSHVTNRAA